MEVAGRTDNSSRGSVKQLINCCQPCLTDGQHVEAEGFCQNCKEYLCITCITHHRKVTLTKNHAILDKHNMPTNVKQAPTFVCTEICEKHGTEVVKFFCKQHESVGCGDCMILEHKSCKVDYIPDIAEAFLKGGEFSALAREISRLQSIVKSASEEIERTEKEAEKSYIETVSDIRTFRKEINDYLDRMEQRLLDKCDKIKQGNSNAIQKMGKYFEDLKKELDMIHGQITSKEEESTYKFVKARKASSALKSLESHIYTTDGRSRLKVCQLNRNQFYNVILSKGIPLGEIEVTTQRQGNVQNEIGIPKRERFINVKSSSDRMGCNISGIAALSDTTIACTDWNNHKIKLIDVTDGTLSSEIDVEPDPRDLTLIPNEEIAVTLNSAQKIQFLSFKQSLCKGRFIKVNGKCRGITYSKDRLVVSYDKDPKVEILNLRGKVLKYFKRDYTGKALFIYPLYVAVSSGDDIIYVSDQAANSVYKLTFDGQVLTTYKDPDLLNPRKLVVCENDYMLVCNFSKSNVQLVSPGNRKLMNILDRVDVLGYCMALHYDEEHAKLYLSNYESRFQIQMFKMT